jgi:hypothetical protein
MLAVYAFIVYDLCGSRAPKGLENIARVYPGLLF